MTRTWVMVALGLLPAFAAAQKLELKLEAIAARASEKAEVDLDGASLGAVQKMAGSLPKAVAGLRELHVRAYEFAKPGAWSDQELEPLRKQVAPGSGWTRIVSVKDKTDAVEVYLFTSEGKTGGVLVLAAEPKELAVVHVVGEISIDKLQEIVKSNIQYDLKSVVAAAAARPSGQ